MRFQREQFVKNGTLGIAMVTAMGALLVMFDSTASAHGTFSEKQRVRKTNFVDKGNPAVLPQEGEDFDFDYPFNIIWETAIKNYDNFPPALGVDEWRSDVAIGVYSVLRGNKDYDVFQYDKFDPAPHIFSGYPIVAYCKVYEKFQPAVALAGPLGTTNIFGQEVFSAPPDDFPADIVAALPEGYGVKVVTHSGDTRTRTTYNSHHANIEWFLPLGIWDGECIEGLGDLEATNEQRVSDGLEPCDPSNTIFETIATPGTYYYIVYDAKNSQGYHRRKARGQKFMWDYTFITGTTDAFTPFDWARNFARASESNFGAQISNVCRLPQ